MVSIDRQLRNFHFLLESKESIWEFKYDDIDLKFYKVDGGKIRTNDEAEFIGGGHHLVYTWMPDNEVWLEDTFDNKELSYFSMHEMLEYLLMYYKNYSYDKAHDVANYYENFLRREPKTAEKTIKDYVKEYHKDREDLAETLYNFWTSIK